MQLHELQEMWDKIELAIKRSIRSAELRNQLRRNLKREIPQFKDIIATVYKTNN